MDINARRHPQPFEPGQLVTVKTMFGEFRPGEAYEVKSGPNDHDMYELWTDYGPCRYEMAPAKFLFPADVEG